MSIIYYKEKYLKYKTKYTELKQKLYGGRGFIPKRNDDTMLNFIKNIIEENVKIRFREKPDFQFMLKNIRYVGDINDFKNEEFEFILTKGYDRLYRLIDYIVSDEEFNSKSNNCKALIVAQFIIINQVFGDANHRTSIFVLTNYSEYTEDEIITIMSVTERIHVWNGNLKFLWTGEEANKLPNFVRLYDNPDISGLLKKV